MARSTIVAELGRPETLDETVARRAEQSRLHRQRHTLTNLLLALAASIGIVLLIVLVVPRSNTPVRPAVDVSRLAAEAAPDFTSTPVAPVLPAGWRANDARVETGADNLRVWHIGYITPDGQYIGLYQTDTSSPSWLANTLEGQAATGSAAIGGVTWTVYDHRSSRAGNARYALARQQGGTTYVLLGTASPSAFNSLAAAL